MPAQDAPALPLLSNLCYIAFTLQIVYGRWQVWEVPEPLGLEAPDTLFSEARAMLHVRHLAEETPHRQVKGSSSLSLKTALPYPLRLQYTNYLFG